MLKLCLWTSRSRGLVRKRAYLIHFVKSLTLNFITFELFLPIVASDSLPEVAPVDTMESPMAEPEPDTDITMTDGNNETAGGDDEQMGICGSFFTA